MSITFIAATPTLPLKASTVAVPSIFSGFMEFGNKEMILTAVFTATFPNAFPENTFTLHVKPFPVSGNAIAPEIKPAFKRTDKRGATAFATRSCEKITTSAPVASTALATKRVICWLSASLTEESTNTLFAP